MRIYKYALDLFRSDCQVVAMPSGAVIVKVDLQHGTDLCLWAIVNELQPIFPRNFMICATGQLLPASSSYIGTVFQGEFVWHIVQC